MRVEGKLIALAIVSYLAVMPTLGLSKPRVLNSELVPIYGEASPVGDLRFNKIQENSILTDGKIIRYELFYLSEFRGSSIYTPEFVGRVIDSATREFFVFLSYKGININSECRNMSVQVYHVTMPVLNSNRFGNWQESNRVSHMYDSNIWALFDPMFNEEYDSAIYLTDHGRYNESSFAHELGHYWYDRYCVYNYWSGGGEPFAREFQSFYESRSSR